MHAQQVQMTRLAAIVVVAGGSMFIAATSQAGVTVFGNTGWQAEWDASLDGLVDIEFNGTASNAIFIQKSAEFTQGPDIFGFFPSIPIVFRQVALSSITHIVINDEIITNSTGAAWTDFHMDILDNGDAAFNPGLTALSGGAGPIGFTIEPFTVASFANANTQLNISGGTVPNGGIWFPGDGVSDGQLWIDVFSGGPGDFTVFTLKETPTPTPGVLALLGLAGLAGRSRRRS